MRKLIRSLMSGMVCGVLLVPAVIAGVEYMTTGWGQIVTVTAAAQQIKVGSAKKVSVYNAAGSATNLNALVNCTTNEFNARVAATNAISIPGATSFTFDCQNSTKQIDSVCLSSTGDTYTVYIAAF